MAARVRAQAAAFFENRVKPWIEQTKDCIMRLEHEKLEE
uniref:Uncharacterized protein n=1 Tax=Arundo donax TaxID=35708 RepID=A0A0A8ZU36_ARUDO